MKVRVKLHDVLIQGNSLVIVDLLIFVEAFYGWGYVEKSDSSMNKCFVLRT